MLFSKLVNRGGINVMKSTGEGVTYMKTSFHKKALSHYSKTASSIIALALSAIIASGPAYAQDVPPAGTEAENTGGLQDIIVIARKRTENLQDVPLAVTAIGAQQLEESSANTIDDLDRLAPNVELGSTSFAAKSLTATIRGIGFADVEKSFEPAVGVSIDGVFLATSGGGSLDAFDIQSVEILRGPQGTLYGRNTVGGVINVKRSAPTDTPGFKTKLRIGNHGRAEALFVANTGRHSGLALKGYYFETHSKTFARNTVTNRKEDLSDNKSYGFALNYDDGPFNGTVSVDLFDDNSGQNPVYNLSQPTQLARPGDPAGPTNPVQTGSLFCNFTAGPGRGPIPFVYPETLNAGCSARSYDLAVASGFETYIAPFPVKNSTDGFSITGNFDLDLGENLTLSSVSGFRKSDEFLGTDNLGSPQVRIGSPLAPLVPLFYSSRNVSADQFSQELRLSGKIGGSFDFVSGIFYMNTNYELTPGVGPNGPTPGNTFAFGNNPGTAQEIGQDTNAYAVFADGTFKITDGLSLSAGIRYNKEEKTLKYNYLRRTVPVAGLPGEKGSSTAKFDDITGRAILQYDLSDDAMVFAGWSRGFRSGGFNGRAGSATAIGPYQPERVDNFEGGLRLELFDRRLRFNPTAFYTKYSDKQEEIVRASGANATETIVENAASAKIWGIELEAQAQITDGLSLRGNAGYLNAKYGSFIIRDPASVNPLNPTFIDVAAQRQLRRAPKWTAAGGIRFEQPIGGVKLIATADYNYVAKNASNLTRDTYIRNGVQLSRDIIEAQSNFDFSLSLGSNETRGPEWQITSYIRDAFDKNPGRLSTVLDAGPFYFGAGQVTKQYGLELTLGF
jgi:iron complex outermembrane recepter protein